MPSASWVYETPAEYHVVSNSLLPPSSPALFKKKRASEIDIPPPLPPPRPLFEGSPLPSPNSPTPFTPPPFKSREARASTGSASIERSLKHSRSYGTPPGWHAPASVSGPERNLPARWSRGALSVKLTGEGGSGGGELRVLRSATRKAVFSIGLPGLADSGVWGISDIQHIHPSISARTHGLSLRLTGCRVLEEQPPSSSTSDELCCPLTHQESASSASSQSAMSPPKSFMSVPFGRKRQPSEGSRLFGVIPMPSRGRSKTISASDVGSSIPSLETTPSFVPSISSPVWVAPPAPLAPSVAPTQTLKPQGAGEQEIILFLAFPSQRIKDEWYAILRSLARIPLEEGRLLRAHRRLRIAVLDIQEVQQANHMPMPDLDGSSSQQDGSSTSEGRPGKSPGKRRELEIKRAHAKPGWSWKDQIRAELLLDDRLVARTGWTKAAEGGATPFWGEQFNLTEVPHFSTCTLLLLRQKKDKISVVFGRVDLPLVSSFTNADDERYPVRSVTGNIIGEIRLSVSYQQVNVVPLAEYNSLQLAHSENASKFLYVMAGRGQMEGSMEYLCRIALCEGTLMDRVRDTATIEARSAGTTLFRSTTPLSKTLEVLMRMMCSEFLEASLGPTINRVLRESIEPRLFQPNYSDESEPVLNFRALGVMTELIQTCWGNMYDNRHLFPNFIRHILAHLFRMVKEFHDDGDDRLRYKAVSSFVFLRLIGPALMSPHLFGLANSVLDPRQQRTLTLIAKVLHTLAFFSDKDLVRHSDLALFKVFIQANNDVMIDYLVSLATPSGDPDARSSISPEVECMLKARRSIVPSFHAEAIPHLTAAGPVDLSADWAVCCETWYEKRQHPGVKLTTLAEVVAELGDIAELIDKYDEFLDRIHGLSSLPELIAFDLGIDDDLVREPSDDLDWDSRPSLNLSISTTPSSEDSAPERERPRRGHKPNLSIDTKLCAVRRPAKQTPSSDDESPTTARQPRIPRPRTPASPALRRLDMPSIAVALPPPLPTSPLSPRKDKGETQRPIRRRRPTLQGFKLLGRSEPPPPMPPLIWQAGLGPADLSRS